MVCRREWLGKPEQGSGPRIRRKQHRCPQLRAWRAPSEVDAPGAFSAKRPDEGHKFFGPFRVLLGVGLQVFRAPRRLKNTSRREPHLVASGFRSFHSMWHLDLSLTQQVSRWGGLISYHSAQDRKSVV